MRNYLVLWALMTVIVMLFGCATSSPARPSTNSIVYMEESGPDAAGSDQTSPSAGGGTVDDYMEPETGYDQGGEAEADEYGSEEGGEEDYSGEDEETPEYGDEESGEDEQEEGYDSDPWG